MKKNIHPQYYHDAVVTCSCGNTFTTGSTKKQIHVEICAQCHPFFTGEMKYVDTLGRVERFQKQMAAVSGKKKYVSKKQRQILAKKLEEQDDGQPRTLKEMLQKKIEPKKKPAEKKS